MRAYLLCWAFYKCSLPHCHVSASAHCIYICTATLNRVSLSKLHHRNCTHTHTQRHRPLHSHTLKNTGQSHNTKRWEMTNTKKNGCDFNGKFTHKTSLLPCTPEYNSFTLSSELMLHNSKPIVQASSTNQNMYRYWMVINNTPLFVTRVSYSFTF